MQPHDKDQATGVALGAHGSGPWRRLCPVSALRDPRESRDRLAETRYAPRATMSLEKGQIFLSRGYSCNYNQSIHLPTFYPIHTYVRK